MIINATGNISASGQTKNGRNSGIFSGVGSSGVGNAGGIQINARSLSLSNGAILSANSEGTGAAGNIEVTTVKEIVPARGWIFNEKGEVVLTAYDVNSAEFQRQYLRQNSAGCRAF